MDAVVRAAGGLVWRAGESGAIEIVLVHRPRYDDWTFPKGKLEPGEDEESAAVREVEEETGLRCRVGAEIAETSYLDGKGRPKTVRYFEMTPVSDALAPAHEVDEARWVGLAEAAQALTYAHDRELLARLEGRLEPEAAPKLQD